MREDPALLQRAVGRKGKMNVAKPFKLLPLAFALLLPNILDCTVVGFRTPVPHLDERFAHVSQTIRMGLEERGVPSVSIAVARAGEVVWEQSFGWADREREIRASPNTMYSLASTTKPLTATAVMVLHRSGRLSLDSSVEEYTGPGFLQAHATSPNEITVRRVLHHAAGLPQHFNYFYADETAQPRSPEAALRHFGAIVWAPGQEFSYSNLGYGLLGFLVEQISDRPLKVFMREEVFDPLGMNRTAFDPGPTADLAVKYNTEGGVIPFFRSDMPGSAHAYASAHDLVRFGMFHLRDHLDTQAQIIDDIAIQEMQRAVEGIAYPGAVGTQYGLGWFVGSAGENRRVVWHEGGWTGASAMLKLIPSEDIAVAVLMNVFDSQFVNQVTDEAIQAVLSNYSNPETLALEQIEAPAQPSFRIPAGRYSGDIYIGGRDSSLTLEKDRNGELRAYLGPLSPAIPVRTLPDFVPRLPGHFLGAFPGVIADEDATRHPHDIMLELKETQDGLMGMVSAMGQPPAVTGDQRMNFFLSYRVSLKRLREAP